MSQYFDMGNETLWNPSNGVSRLFLRQVRLFEVELGIPSGIGPMVNDECQLDPAEFEVFVNALLERHRSTRHPVMLALFEGFTTTVLALADRAGITVDCAGPSAAPDSPVEDVQVSRLTGSSAPPEGEIWASRLRERARELSRSM
jgi:hypothetical protein